jgi:arylsulfatase A-like enzyme
MKAKVRLGDAISVLLASLSLTSCTSAQKEFTPSPPNVIIIFADDLGYGDLGVFGHPTIATPHLDRMAREGQKWTSFYVAASVCSPSRAALLTGRLPVRSGMTSDVRRVLFPDSSGGLPGEEVTIAEMLKEQGYKTACVGKWHLGHLPPYLPTRHGFDSYFGIPYSNDMDQAVEIKTEEDRFGIFWEPKSEYWNVPLLRNDSVVERPAEQSTITQRYTEEALRFIRENKNGPFFLYLAHSMPHVPLFASEDFLGTSKRGLYGDVIEEIDWSVGQIIKTLQTEGLANNTLVVFTSDNGPWLLYRHHGGSAGPLYDGKGTTWEGGMRVPALFWWPGKISPRIVSGIGSTLDLLPTVAAVTGAPLPENTLDGLDLSPALFGSQPSPRNYMFFYRGTRIYAVRNGPFKAHYITQPEYVPNPIAETHEPPILYQLEVDPGEQYEIGAEHLEVIREIQQLLVEHRRTLTRGEDQLAERIEP